MTGNGVSLASKEGKKAEGGDKPRSRESIPSYNIASLGGRKLHLAAAVRRGSETEKHKFLFRLGMTTRHEGSPTAITNLYPVGCDRITRAHAHARAVAKRAQSPM